MKAEHWLLRTRLAQFICLVNELQTVYQDLAQNNLARRLLDNIVRRCVSRAENAWMATSQLPELTDNGAFLSQFLIRQCGSYFPLDAHELKPAATGSNVASLLSTNEGVAALSRALRASARRPVHVVLNRTQLLGRAPRWVWDPETYKSERWQRANIVQDFYGREEELGRYRLFTQGQSNVSMVHPPWRRQDLIQQQHSLRDVLVYRPGLVWINAEVWAAPKGKDTGYHYDYDPHVMLFQVVGSRRFHIMPPQSGELEWEPLEKPWTQPIDYGTRWAKQLGPGHEMVIDTQPGSVLKVPNGWPHKVVYRQRSIGFRVASWTQCQAVSMWLGQRLCLLSTMLGEPRRLCFDDEEHRELGDRKSVV